MTIKIPKFVFSEYLAYALIVWSFIRFSFVDVEKNTVWIVPQVRAITYLIDPLFVLLITWLCLINIPKINKKFKYLVILFLMTILLFTLSVVANLNVIRIGNVSKFAIGYLRYIPFMLFSIFYILSKKNATNIFLNIVKICVSLMTIQGVINMLWFFKIQIFKNDKIFIPDNPDWAYGLMENTHLFAISNIILVTFAYFKANNSSRKSEKFLYYLLLLFALLQVVWSESKVNFIVIPICLIITLIFSDKSFNIKKFIGPILMFLSVMLAASFFYANRSHFKGDSIFSSITLASNIIQKTWNHNPKILFVESLLSDIPAKENVPLLGGGPGSVASKFALDAPTKLSAPYFVRFTEHNFLFGNSVITSPRIGVTAIYGDLGILGFICYFGMWIYLFRRITRGYKRNAHNLSSNEKLIYQIWVSLYLTFFANIVFIDSLYIGAPIAILALIAPYLLQRLHYSENKIFTIKNTTVR